MLQAESLRAEAGRDKQPGCPPAPCAASTAGLALIQLAGIYLRSATRDSLWAFGHSSANLGLTYKGLAKDDFAIFKHLRKTRHTHNPVNDALGNAEALLHMKNEMGLKIRLD